jgi:hypothetical protein
VLTTRNAIQDKDPATVVYQFLDNSSFFGRGRDWSRTAARLGEDSKYHLEGEVTIGSKETQLEHLKEIKPLLELVEKRRTMIILITAQRGGIRTSSSTFWTHSS